MAEEPEQQRVLISFATYNERDNLQALIEQSLAQVPHANVLVIDDHSPDGTGELADEMAKADPRIRVIHRPGKQGLGTAILTAMKYAIDEKYDLLINMDADFSHHPRYLPALLAGMRDHDVMIGSRYIPGGGAENWPLSRQLMSRGVNFISRVLLRLPARDTSGAFRCYRVAKLREAELDRVISRGYSFQQEILYRCRKAGCRIGETAIIFENRRAGASKVNWKEAVRSLAVILYIGMKATLRID
ncbi:MAG: hypothetical protein KatS3mg105_1727 [Gemmatales bacterium]|nr:MAG: hypothetical protein KatS3mg105_1727 [Gemmatales bacterium]